MKALVLSYALDTNGQNARFRKAAQRHGSSRAVLEALAIGNDDPAGVVGRFQIAAEKLGGLSIRSVHRTAHYFDFPNDILWTRQSEGEIRALVEEADVIHLNNSPRAAQHFRVRKPMLLHHHGSLFRNNTRQMLANAKAQRMVQAVSTIDLTRPDPDVLHWLPTAYDVSQLMAFGKAHRRKPDGRIRIVSCPTNRELKATDLLIATVKGLQAEGLPIDLELVEGKTWKESLTAKAGADIVFDQLMFGYGCNAVEAWALGVPVIAGGDDWTLERMRELWGGLPFALADEATLTERLRAMVASADLRAEWAAIGLAHVRKYHDEKPALTKLAELYGMAIKAYSWSGRAIPGKGLVTTFRSTTGRAVSLDGQRVEFVNGEARVSDPYLVQRLRYFATHRPGFGIEEVA